MAFTDEMRTRARTLLGDAAKDFDDVQLLSASLTFMEEATRLNIELSTANEDLEAQIVTLSASVPEAPVELSAGEKRLIGENTALKIDAIAKDQHWPTAYTAKVRDLFTGGDVIALSAGETENPLPAKFLDLLKERPAKGLDASGKEQSGPQITTLSRETDDSDPGTKKAEANPLLDTAKAMAGK